MKWTMLTVALLGLATYGMIFLAQLQHERTAPVEVTASPEAAPFETVASIEDVAATLPVADVSEEVEAPVSGPGWSGDPWVVGVEAFESRHDALAVEALSVAVAEREDSSYRHYVLALALRRVGEVEDAVIELERSLELAPGAPKTWVALARCELDRDRTTAARAAVDAALELDLGSADAWHLLGRVELAEGALDHAEAAFAKAFERDHGHAWAANNLGYVRILQGRFSDAVIPLQAAVAQEIEQPEFLNNLGTALERSGQPELAALSFAHAAVRGHEPASVSMERVERDLAARGTTFAAADSVATVGAAELAARVEQAVLLVAVEVADENATGDEPEFAAAAGENDGSRE